jgi:hypothetical protein
MDLSKVKGGQLIAAIGGLALLISLLFLDWYGVEGSIDIGFGNFDISAGASAEFNAWDGQGFLGTLANLVVLAAGIAAVGLAVLTATSRTVALPIAASALTAALGIGAVVMVIGRMLFQPGQGEFVDLKFGIYLALIAAVVVAYGGWQSMQEEGTTFEEARDQLQSRLGEQSVGPGTPPGTERPSAEPPPPPPRPPDEPAPPPAPPADEQ